MMQNASSIGNRRRPERHWSERGRPVLKETAEYIACDLRQSGKEDLPIVEIFTKKKEPPKEVAHSVVIWIPPHPLTDNASQAYQQLLLQFSI